jgi:DNA-binding IclR family transcriptional regulator
MKNCSVMQNTRNPVSKALKALAWLVEHPSAEVGVRELAVALDVAPSSAHRLLMCLAEEGFVGQNADNGRYELGLEFLRLAHLAGGKSPLRQRALPHMRALVDACNETALLGIYDSVRQEMMFAASVESTHHLRYAIDLNKWAPVYTGASGLAILAYLEEAHVQTIMQRTRLAPLTSRTITESYRLTAELETIRQRGYALTHGQRIPGAVGLAAPLFGIHGEVVGDICLTIPEQRFDEASQDHLIDLLLDCTNRITVEIGGTPRRRLALA